MASASLGVLNQTRNFSFLKNWKASKAGLVVACRPWNFNAPRRVSCVVAADPRSSFGRGWVTVGQRDDVDEGLQGLELIIAVDVVAHAGTVAGAVPGVAAEPQDLRVYRVYELAPVPLNVPLGPLCPIGYQVPSIVYELV
jgi:hypothetical protein